MQPLADPLERTDPPWAGFREAVPPIHAPAPGREPCICGRLSLPDGDGVRRAAGSPAHLGWLRCQQSPVMGACAPGLCRSPAGRLPSSGDRVRPHMGTASSVRLTCQNASLLLSVFLKRIRWFSGQRTSAKRGDGSGLRVREGRPGSAFPYWGALRHQPPPPPSFQVAEMRRTLTPANSPVSSPSKHGDRFIPSRAGANWSVNFHRINVRGRPGAGGGGAGSWPQPTLPPFCPLPSGE